MSPQFPARRAGDKLSLPRKAQLEAALADTGVPSFVLAVEGGFAFPVRDAFRKFHDSRVRLPCGREGDNWPCRWLGRTVVGGIAPFCGRRWVVWAKNLVCIGVFGCPTRI